MHQRISRDETHLRERLKLSWETLAQEARRELLSCLQHRDEQITAENSTARVSGVVARWLSPEKYVEPENDALAAHGLDVDATGFVDFCVMVM